MPKVSCVVSKNGVRMYYMDGCRVPAASVPNIADIPCGASDARKSLPRARRTPPPPKRVSKSKSKSRTPPRPPAAPVVVAPHKPRSRSKSKQRSHSPKTPRRKLHFSKSRSRSLSRLSQFSYHGVASPNYRPSLDEKLEKLITKIENIEKLRKLIKSRSKSPSRRSKSRSSRSRSLSKFNKQWGGGPASPSFRRSLLYRSSYKPIIRRSSSRSRTPSYRPPVYSSDLNPPPFSLPRSKSPNPARVFHHGRGRGRGGGRGRGRGAFRGRGRGGGGWRGRGRGGTWKPRGRGN